MPDHPYLTTGMLFFREASRSASSRSRPASDGRKLLMVCGIIEVAADNPHFKSEHQHVVVGNGNFLALTDHVDRTEMAKGQSIGGLLTQPIWGT